MTKSGEVSSVTGSGSGVGTGPAVGTTAVATIRGSSAGRGLARALTERRMSAEAIAVNRMIEVN